MVHATLFSSFGKEKISAYHSVFKSLKWVYMETAPSDLCYIKMVCLKDENKKIVALYYVGPQAGKVIQVY